MRQIAFLAVGLLPLAACNSEPDIDVRNASVEEVAEQVAQADTGDAAFIRAGKWTSTMTIEELTAPGMPAGVGEQMKGMMGADQTSETCLTPEEVKKPKEDFFAGRNSQCRYDHFKMGNGKIDAKMRCSQGGVDQVMEMAGTYSPTDYRMRVKTDLEGAGPQMTMRMRIDAKRVGECAPAEA